MKNILLINPWIYDFAAYDLWLKPWGLLKISSILKRAGCGIDLVDAMDRHHPLMPVRADDRSDGTGKFRSEEVEKPPVLRSIPRKYRKYGIPAGIFRKALPEKTPDVILVSSGMTYWYPGAFEAIRLLREVYGNVTVILGGVYATLAYDHAKEKSGADHVIRNRELQGLPALLGVECDLSPRSILDEPVDYDWYPRTSYGVLRLSLGCPFDCSYCAQKMLGPEFILKSEDRAGNELEDLRSRDISIFAFYDDALLADGEYIKSYLHGVVADGRGDRFYTPNGLHARFIDDEIAFLMKKAGFINPVLSLETVSASTSESIHDKVTVAELRKAVRCLMNAGYRQGEYTVYLMMGIPGVGLDEVRRSMDFVHSLGAKISLSEFSPIPGTKICGTSGVNIQEPLLHNNSIYPSFALEEWDEVLSAKGHLQRLNSSLK